MSRRPMASAPSPVATASHSAATTKNPVAAASGLPGISVRRRLGGTSYGRIFFGLG